MSLPQAEAEEDILDALADGGLLAAPPVERPATAEETYMHHVGMRRATIFSGCLCGVRCRECDRAQITDTVTRSFWRSSSPSRSTSSG